MIKPKQLLPIENKLERIRIALVLSGVQLINRSAIDNLSSAIADLHKIREGK